MAKGIGAELHDILTKLIKSDDARGIYMNDLRVLTQYHIEINQLNLPLSNAIFTPLTEMFLCSHDMGHEIRYNRTGVFISGIGFKLNDTSELVNTLSLGVSGSPARADSAKRLYETVFAESNLKSSRGSTLNSDS